MRENPKPNQIYRHFKGNFYKIICIATHSETGEQLVVYQALYGDMGVYVRPLDMFLSLTDKEKYPDVAQKYRFALMEDVIANLETPKQPVKTETVVAKQPETGEESKVSKAVSEEKLPVTGNEVKQPGAAAFPQQSMDADAQQNAEGPELAPELLAYLDADTNKQRLEILIEAKEKLTQEMITTMAAVIDVDIDEGDLVVRYEQLKYCLETKIRYEVTRR